MLSFTDNFRDLGDDFMSKDIVLDLHNPLDFMIQHYSIPSDALSHALCIQSQMCVDYVVQKCKQNYVPLHITEGELIQVVY